MRTSPNHRDAVGENSRPAGITRPKSIAALPLQLPGAGSTCYPSRQNNPTGGMSEMAHFESIPAGFPCWLELETTDQAAAKNFYTSLFGWSVADYPMEPGVFYSMFSLGNRNVAAAYQLSPEMKAEGVRPHWAIYFAVDSADETTARARSLGAAVIMEPMDVMDVGRMTGGLFPQGRYFGNGVGVGFDAVVGFEALKLKWLTGFPSYIVATLKTVFLYFDAPLVRVDYDDKTLKLPALMVSTMNGRRLGGGFFMAPEGKPDDGLFDICIARQVGRARVFTLVPHFMKGTQATQPEITMLQARRVVITAERGVLPAHIDGETASLEGKQITLELLPRQMEFLTPYGATA